jgi:uncharacterized protein DUF6600
MTRRLFLAILALAAPPWSRAQAPQPPPEEAPLTFETFHAGLAPYGTWEMVEPYGVVWRPGGVAPDWRPYLDGSWVWTDDGWFWASDEPWAWATYHYGRWVYDPANGWVWIPGYEWAPAWVAWRSGDDAVGWAPLYPGYGDWWAEDYPLQPGAWVFVPVGSLAGVPIPPACYPPHQAPHWLRRTRPAPPRAVPGHGAEAAPPRGGPPPALVERSTGRPILPVRVASVRTPDAARGGPRDGSVRVFRPPPAAAGPRPQAAARPAPRTPAAPPVASPPHGGSAQHGATSAPSRH